jgi:hypothetical protein
LQKEREEALDFKVLFLNHYIERQAKKQLSFIEPSWSKYITTIRFASSSCLCRWKYLLLLHLNAPHALNQDYLEESYPTDTEERLDSSIYRGFDDVSLAGDCTHIEAVRQWD